MIATVDEYVQEKSLEIAAEIGSQKIVYLDTMYWIRLRNENRETEPQKKEFFRLVTELVATKKCVFPISEMTFWEIMKQGDIKSRNETMQMVDLFSGGISIVNTKERVKIEFGNWFLTRSGVQQPDVKTLIWSNLYTVLGHHYFSRIPDVSLRDAILDYVSKSSLLEIGMSSNIIFKYKEDTESINNNVAEHSSENKTLEDMIISELNGYLDVYLDLINEVIDDKYFREYGRRATTEEKNSMDMNAYKTFIRNSFKMGKITNELPVFHIVPSLFAWCRWIKRTFTEKDNYTMDFYHASFALPYCDYFFTERTLCSGIKELKLDRLYGCTVISKPSEIMKELNSINCN